MAKLNEDTVEPAGDELRIAEHYLYKLGLFHNDELAPNYVQTHREIDYAPAEMPLHSHKFFELSYVRKCQDMDYVIGAKQYCLKEGDILLIPPNTLHGAVLTGIKQKMFIRDVLWISPHFLNRMALMTPGKRLHSTQGSIVFRTTESRWGFLGELFHNGILERERQMYGWESMVVSNTMQLLAQLTRALLDSSILILKDEKPDPVALITDYIENNLPDKITLEKTAELFRISKSSISQIFRKELGTSFYAYVTRRRLLMAKSLIAQGVRMEQVGKQVGFTEYSAFYRAFRKEFGITPKEYKDSCGSDV